MRRFLANLGLPVIKIALLHHNLSAVSPCGHVALKKGLKFRFECVYRSHMVTYL